VLGGLHSGTILQK
jgi:hypothetical protein